jgi:glutamyl-tRNA reductase
MDRNAGGRDVEPTLMVIGLNHRTAPIAIRERFWISETRRYEALTALSRAEAIEEVLVLATCNRTEFYLWANDVTLADDSVLRFLTAEYGLTLGEWQHFYRLMDDAALMHIFRVASSLDSMVIGEPQIISQVKDAWRLAQKLGASGRNLDAVLQKALTVSKRVRNETAIGNSSVSVPFAAVDLARQVLGTLEQKHVLLLGAGKMSELSARYLSNNGAASICVINRTFEHAQELATQLGGTAARLEDRWQHLVEADIVLASTSCPHSILSRDEAELLGRERQGRVLVLLDIAMPRDIDPEVRSVSGMCLYDIDDLEQIVRSHRKDREAAAAEAQLIVAAETQTFQKKLRAERVVPTIVALRHRLDEICRQELDSFQHECGPFSRDQDQMLKDVAARITRRIAGSLARELKEFPEEAEQDQLAAAVQKLFHLATPEKALAGANIQVSAAS